jgi:hypothetical protein
MGIRTTITLDEDVAKSIDRLVAERGSRPKDVVNELLRIGLRSARAPAKRETYTLEPVDLGRCLIGDVADVAAALAAAEGDRYR